MVYDRELNVSRSGSFFLFGPRQTGKTTLVKALLGPHDLYINLLPELSFLAYAKEPGRFRAEVLAHQKRHPNFRCVVDEVQKLPGLLDEVHDLIESTNIRFTLTGSSSRKLKRGGANLLAGRAATISLFPLLWSEIGEHFSLSRALQVGQLPKIWSDKHERALDVEFLEAYASMYLREEILQEGIVRRVAPFARFLDIAAENDAQLVNFSTVARDCGVSVKTSQQYYEILEDTFLATRLEPWHKSVRKRLVAASKYYFFDSGVTNALAHRLAGPLTAEEQGRRFEGWFINQLRGTMAYHKMPGQLNFWRTYAGQEVDIILSRNGRPIAAVEIKSGARLARRDTLGLHAFREDYPGLPAFVVTNESVPQDGGSARRRELEGGIVVLPWRLFLEEELQQFK